MACPCPSQSARCSGSFRECQSNGSCNVTTRPIHAGCNLNLGCMAEGRCKLGTHPADQLQLFRMGSAGLLDCGYEICSCWHMRQSSRSTRPRLPISHRCNPVHMAQCYKETPLLCPLAHMLRHHSEELPPHVLCDALCHHHTCRSSPTSQTSHPSDTERCCIRLPHNVPTPSADLHMEVHRTSLPTRYFATLIWSLYHIANCIQTTHPIQTFGNQKCQLHGKDQGRKVPASSVLQRHSRPRHLRVREPAPLIFPSSFVHRHKSDHILTRKPILPAGKAGLA